MITPGKPPKTFARVIEPVKMNEYTKRTVDDITNALGIGVSNSNLASNKKNAINKT